MYKELMSYQSLSEIKQTEMSTEEDEKEIGSPRPPRNAGVSDCGKADILYGD